jgi:hypothetical protein
MEGRLPISIEIPSDLKERADFVTKSKSATARVKRICSRPTLESTLIWIESLDVPTHRKEILKNEARKCPNGALRQFMIKNK